LDERSQVLANGALEAYVSHFSARNHLGPIIWHRELFSVHRDAPEDLAPSASQPVDVTGRPRLLISGPSFSLPPGRWSAHIALGFSKEAAEIGYLVEVFAGRQLTQIR